jgi:hypothetical protein
MADSKQPGPQKKASLPGQETHRPRVLQKRHTPGPMKKMVSLPPTDSDFIEFGPTFLGASVGIGLGWLEDLFDWKSESPGLGVLDSAFLATERQIAWGAKVSREFKDRVIQIADSLEFDPSWLMAAMAFESGETFSASVPNAAGSGAVGLIQFMPNTAQRLHTSSDQLKGMTAVQQLDYVEAYFANWKGKIHNLSDLYMVILWPAAVGQSDDYVLFDKNDTKNPQYYTQNKGLDLDNDGKVTKKEAATPVQKKLDKGLSSGYIG